MSSPEPQSLEFQPAAAAGLPKHVLVLYGSSPAGEAALREAARLAAHDQTALTVLTVAVLERLDRLCCDMRSVYWNGELRELAAEDLAAAKRVLGADCGAEFAVACGESLARVLAEEAEERGCDVIVLPGRRNRLVAGLRRGLPRAVGRRTQCAVVEAPSRLP